MPENATFQRASAKASKLATPKWAPVDVVRYYEGLLGAANLGRNDPSKRDSWKKYARAEGFTRIEDFDACIDLKLGILKRLVSRPEMKATWAWISSERRNSLPLTSPHGLVGRVLWDVEHWVTSNRVPDSERRSDFKDISRYAALLSRKIRKYRGEPVGFHALAALVPEGYEPILRKALHPDLVSRMDKRRGANAPLRMYLRQILPPIDEMLDAMASHAKDNYFELGTKFPTKLGAESAFKTFMIRSCTASFRDYTHNYSPTIIAKFVSVALDDPSIGTDTVRKGAADLARYELTDPAEDSSQKIGKIIRDRKRAK